MEDSWNDELQDESEHTTDREDNIKLTKKRSKNNRRDATVETNYHMTMPGVSRRTKEESEQFTVLDGLLDIWEEGLNIRSKGNCNKRVHINQIKNREAHDDKFNHFCPPELFAGTPATVVTSVSTPVESNKGIWRVEVDCANATNKDVEDQRNDLRSSKDHLQPLLVSARSHYIRDIPVQV